LAGTPDDLPTVDDQLAGIARLAADRVGVVAYASITAMRGQGYTTVAASSALARAVDEAQYGDGAGPCVQALDDAAPVGVPDIAATMSWPGFREKAVELGLRASVSVPLFGGSGATLAALNLYGHDRFAMAPLLVGIWAVYDPDRPMPDGTAGLPAPDPGATELIEGFAEALAVRASIQLALGVIMAGRRCAAADAYVVLRLRAAAAGVDLATAAAALIGQSA
jgi:hypothetical protein